MTRLKHSYNGFIRGLQISRTGLFLFVEGYPDPYFYGVICRFICGPKNIQYEIVTAKQIPGETGGKRALIEFHDLMRKKNKLSDNSFGKKTEVLFVIDKDVDDYRKKKKRSRYIAYTEYYCLENHIYFEGELIKGAAAATGVDPTWLSLRLGEPSRWRKKASEKWIDWVKLCFFASINNIGCECTYSAKTSCVNDSTHGGIDKKNFIKNIRRLKRGSKYSTEEFMQKYRYISRKIDKIYLKGDQDKVFKGKWYSGLLASDIINIANTEGKYIQTSALPALIMHNILTTYEPSDNIPSYIAGPLVDSINRLTA